MTPQKNRQRLSELSAPPAEDSAVLDAVGALEGACRDALAALANPSLPDNRRRLAVALNFIEPACHQAGLEAAVDF